MNDIKTSGRFYYDDNHVKLYPNNAMSKCSFEIVEDPIETI